MPVGNGLVFGFRVSGFGVSRAARVFLGASRVS